MITSKYYFKLKYRPKPN